MQHLRPDSGKPRAPRSPIPCVLSNSCCPCLFAQKTPRPAARPPASAMQRASAAIDALPACIRLRNAEKRAAAQPVNQLTKDICAHSTAGHSHSHPAPAVFCGG